MPDALFSDPRLAILYDVFDDDRRDLDAYVDLLAELDAKSVLDLGCGTGTLALRLADPGRHVVGVDPAGASLDIARAKPGAERVEWRLGDAGSLAGVAVDAATMTGNTAQAILGAAWPDTLAGLRAALRPGGHLVFESRVPAQRAWEGWIPERTRQRHSVPGIGSVESWAELLDVSEPLVTFRHVYVFPDGARLVSESTLEFRTLDQLTAQAEAASFEVVEVRDAPDRPGLEHVLVCRAR